MSKPPKLYDVMDAAKLRGAEEMREAIRKILREHAKRLSRTILCERVEEQMDALDPKKEKA